MEKLVRSVARSLMDYVRQNICPRLTLEAIVRGEIDPADLGDLVAR